MLVSRLLVVFPNFRFFSLALFIVFICLPGVSLSDNSWFVEPYLGVDLGLRHMTWKKGYGDNVYKHGALQPNVYAGLKFCPYLGVELGYEHILPKTRDVYFASAQTVTILDVPFEGPVSVRSSVKLKGWHISMVGFYPLPCWDCFELLGTLGAAKLKTRQQVFIFYPMEDRSLLRTFVKDKIVPRISAGFQYKMTDNFTLRAILIGIEKVSPFDLGVPVEYTTSALRTKMKYNLYHSLGMVFVF